MQCGTGILGTRCSRSTSQRLVDGNREIAWGPATPLNLTCQTPKKAHNIGAVKITSFMLGVPCYSYIIIHPKTLFQLARPLYSSSRIPKPEQEPWVEARRTLRAARRSGTASFRN